MNKADIKLIPLAINNVIATSGSTFNGYHLFNVGNGDYTDNKFFEVKNGKDVGENLYDTSNTEQYTGKYFMNVSAESTASEGTINLTSDISIYLPLEGYYTLADVNIYSFVSSSLPASN